MEAAIESISEAGAALLGEHGAAGARAAEVCRNWKLAERQHGERKVLQTMLDASEDMLQSLAPVLADKETGAAQFTEAAASIERNLPVIEDAFLELRHCAQDLLHWAQRFAPLEGSSRPDEYRAAHGELIAFAPVFKPRLESLQMALVEKMDGNQPSVEAGRLLSAITRYNGILDTARRFVRAVVEPPLELVFAETDRFLADMQALPLSDRAELASELNDCCQSLQYDRPAFDRRVESVATHQPTGADSSLALFKHRDHHVLLTVEEDPIFEQMTVHLLRVADTAGLPAACSEVTCALDEEWGC